MRELTGIGVSPGVVVGPVGRFVREVAEPPAGPPGSAPELPAADRVAEGARLAAALSDTAADLDARAAGASDTAAEVLAATAMMAADPGLAAEADRLVRVEGVVAAEAVRTAFAGYRAVLEAAGGYLGARVSDLDDVRDRVVARLLGRPMPGLPDPGHPFVLVASDLAPADTATLRPETVLALVTEEGGPTSHTAILANALGIPAVVACAGATGLSDGGTVAVDGGTGVVTADPEPAVVAAVRARAPRSARTLPAGGGRTADGVHVALLANVGDAAGMAAAVRAGAEGAGLFRTELLYLDRSTAPTQAEQVTAYRAVFEAAEGRPVVLRTLDAGADKPLPFLGLAPEPNPALGVRGVRAFQVRPDVFDSQLDAVAAAAAGSGADVWVMAPMVSTPDEAAEVAAAVHARGLPSAGLMIEVPAAALTARHCLAEVEFASLGTNDLAQYTLAADRQSAALAALTSPWQPALLRLVAMTASAGAELGRPVGVCGEAAADPALAAVLVGLGVTSLSMTARALPDVAAVLASRDVAAFGELAADVLDARTADDARALVRAALPALPDLAR